MPSRAKDWLAQAERDLLHAQHSLDDGDYDWACFASHQASEKALKAVFQSIRAQVIIGHSLRDMVAEWRGTVQAPQELSEAARLLDRYYISARYPDAYPSGSPFQFYVRRDAEEAVGLAGKMVG